MPDSTANEWHCLHCGGKVEPEQACPKIACYHQRQKSRFRMGRVLDEPCPACGYTVDYLTAMNYGVSPMLMVEQHVHLHTQAKEA